MGKIGTFEIVIILLAIGLPILAALLVVLTRNNNNKDIL